VAYRLIVPPAPVTFPADALCLKVSGNQATIVATQFIPTVPISVAIKVTVVDAPPGEPDQSGSSIRFNEPVLPSCETPLAVAPAHGSVVVTDAQPFPTSKQQCKNGGWRNFGDTFRNQGECVAFVERGQKP
jgi:hypothetical protein